MQKRKPKPDNSNKHIWTTDRYVQMGLVYDIDGAKDKDK